jgi:hypothetical protein
MTAPTISGHTALPSDHHFGYLGPLCPLKREHVSTVVFIVTQGPFFLWPKVPWPLEQKTTSSLLIHRFVVTVTTLFPCDVPKFAHLDGDAANAVL